MPPSDRPSAKLAQSILYTAAFIAAAAVIAPLHDPLLPYGLAVAVISLAIAYLACRSLAKVHDSYASRDRTLINSLLMAVGLLLAAGTIGYHALYPPGPNAQEPIHSLMIVMITYLGFAIVAFGLSRELRDRDLKRPARPPS